MPRHEANSFEMLSPNEVGRTLGVSGQCVKQWIYGGKLPAQKLPNGFFRIQHADLVAYLASQGHRKAARKLGRKPIFTKAQKKLIDKRIRALLKEELKRIVRGL